jgi:hypothetical protein
MKGLKHYEQTVEDDHHWEEALLRLEDAGEDESREHHEPSDDPSEGEDSEHDIACVLKFRILQSFRSFHKNVSAVMHHEDKRANSVNVADPAEGDQHESDDVMDEHLPEVLPLVVSELRKRQRPVERQ